MNPVWRSIMSRLRILLLIITVSTLSCKDMGTNVSWPDWDLVQYQRASFRVPPHATWFSFPGPQLVREGALLLDGDFFVIWLNYGPGLQDLYNTRRACLSSEVPANFDGHPAMITHFTCDPMGNDGPQRVMSVFVPDVGDGNQLLLYVEHYDPGKAYVEELVAQSIHIQ
jgi:hypothetical protein